MPAPKTVTFVQNQLPGLRAGSYAVTATVTVNQAAPNTFTAGKQFAVAGSRFQLAGDDIVAVFPPHLANGSFDGVLPHVVLRRASLPWLRPAVAAENDAPWLAVLVFPAASAPKPGPATVADLVPQGTAITGPDGKMLGNGAMPQGTVSCPEYHLLEYGETPGDAVTVIDIDAATFWAMAPSKADLELLAHVRLAGTEDSEDTVEDTAEDMVVRRAVVMGNRLPAANASAMAFLVSLEHGGALLPDDAGLPSGPACSGEAPQYVRLAVLHDWQFFVNDLDQTFEKLLEHLTRDSQGNPAWTSLRLPGPTPPAGEVRAALAAQAAGTLTDAQADILVETALAQGYVPMDHALRQPGNTVSWYRGPLVPFGFPPFLDVPLPGPDAALRYDPQTGMFDASYAAAWQLGQLLALQSQVYASTLGQWKTSLRRGQAAQEDQARFLDRLGGASLFAGLAANRAAATRSLPEVPEAVGDFLGDLRLLRRVPFSYLVPDERLLPPESIRIFQLDPNWIEALVDGALSIGRTTGNECLRDAGLVPLVRRHGLRRMFTRRTNHPAHLAARLAGRLARLSVADAAPAAEPVSGFLIRSQVVSGWPRLDVNGYADPDGNEELPKLRLERLADDVLLGLVAGRLASLAVHEPPEQLHSGVEGDPGAWVTTLRAVTDANPAVHPGEQLRDGDRFATAPILTRADGQTVRVAQSARGLMEVLNAKFSQKLTDFTAEKWALQMVKGVVRVDYQLTA